jgi:hypothetical protein
MQPAEIKARGRKDVFLTALRSQGHPQPNASLYASDAFLSLTTVTEACRLSTYICFQFLAYLPILKKIE